MNYCAIHERECRLAAGRFTWGMYSEFHKGGAHQQQFLCLECADKLWEACRGPVMLGLMHFVVEEPSGLKDYREDWIQNRAYFKWVVEGHPAGHQLRHWLEAQREYESEVQRS